VPHQISASPSVASFVSPHPQVGQSQQQLQQQQKGAGKDDDRVSRSSRISQISTSGKKTSPSPATKSVVSFMTSMSTRKKDQSPSRRTFRFAK
jgi:hypothetical protein